MYRYAIFDIGMKHELNRQHFMLRLFCEPSDKWGLNKYVVGALFSLNWYRGRWGLG